MIACSKCGHKQRQKEDCFSCGKSNYRYIEGALINYFFKSKIHPKCMKCSSIKEDICFDCHKSRKRCELCNILCSRREGIRDSIFLHNYSRGTYNSREISYEDKYRRVIQDLYYAKIYSKRWVFARPYTEKFYGMIGINRFTGYFFI